MRPLLLTLAFSGCLACGTGTDSPSTAGAGASGDAAGDSATAAADAKPPGDAAGDGGAPADATPDAGPDPDTGSDPDAAPLPPEGCAAIAGDCLARLRGCMPASGARAAVCAPCPVGTYPSGPYAQCAAIPGEPREHDFVTVTLQPGEELSSVCQSWFLQNDEELWVNAVEFVSGGGYHHSNWFFVPDGGPNDPGYPAGRWDGCYSGGFDELAAAQAGGVIFAQSTQVARELQKFPEGVAVRIPPWSRIIGATHLLNVFPEPLETPLRMVLYTISADEVATPLVPFRLSYVDLDIPAGTKASFSSECNFSQFYSRVTFDDFRMRLFYVLPHYHALGTGFRLGIWGGPRDGETLFELGAFGPDPFGAAFDPPVDLASAKGLAFSCRYHNTLGKKVGWGIGDNEMCVMLGFADTEVAFDGHVLATDSTTTGPDGLSAVGACHVAGFPFDQKRPGGRAPGSRP